MKPQGMLMEVKVPEEVKSLAMQIDQAIEGHNTATICAALAIILNRVLAHVVDTPAEYWALWHVPIGEWVCIAVKDGGGDVQEVSRH